MYMYVHIYIYIYIYVPKHSLEYACVLMPARSGDCMRGSRAKRSSQRRKVGRSHPFLSLLSDLPSAHVCYGMVSTHVRARRCARIVCVCKHGV